MLLQEYREQGCNESVQIIAATVFSDANSKPFLQYMIC